MAYSIQKYFKNRHKYLLSINLERISVATVATLNTGIIDTKNISKINPSTQSYKYFFTIIHTKIGVTTLQLLNSA
jgi:hypothetical protein